MSLETWVSLAALLGVAMTLYAALNRSIAALKNDIKDARAEAKADNVRLETTLRADITNFETTLRVEVKGVETTLRTEIKDVETTLRAEIKGVDNRVYALASGLKPAIEQAQAAGN